MNISRRRSVPIDNIDPMSLSVAPSFPYFILLPSAMTFQPGDKQFRRSRDAVSASLRNYPLSLRRFLTSVSDPSRKQLNFIFSFFPSFLMIFRLIFYTLHILAIWSFYILFNSVDLYNRTVGWGRSIIEDDGKNRQKAAKRLLIFSSLMFRRGWKRNESRIIKRS